jgi:hypothetical protein
MRHALPAHEFGIGKNPIVLYHTDDCHLRSPAGPGAPGQGDWEGRQPVGRSERILRSAPCNLVAEGVTMTISRISYVASMLIAFFAGALLIAASGCWRGVMYDSPWVTYNGINLDEVIIARVGETDMTLADLLEVPQLYGFIDEKLIKPEIVRQDAEHRNVDIDMEVVQKNINDSMKMGGGYERFIQNATDQGIPRVLIDDDVRTYFAQQETLNALVGLDYDTVHGPPSERQIREAWDRDAGYFQAKASDDLGISTTDVTFDIARPYILEKIKYDWVQPRIAEYLANLRQTWDIENYLIERINNMDRVIVPAVTESSFDLEPMEEHGAAEETPEGRTEPGTETPAEPESRAGRE